MRTTLSPNNTQTLEQRIASFLYYDHLEEEFEKNNVKEEKPKSINSKFFSAAFRIMASQKIPFTTDRNETYNNISLLFPRDYWNTEKIFLGGFLSPSVHPMNVFMAIGAYYNSLFYSFYNREDLNYGQKDCFNEFDVVLGVLIAKYEGLPYTNFLSHFYKVSMTDENIQSMAHYMESRILSLQTMGIVDDEFRPTFKKGKDDSPVMPGSFVPSLTDLKKMSLANSAHAVNTQKTLGLYRPQVSTTPTIPVPRVVDPHVTFIEFLLEA